VPPSRRFIDHKPYAYEYGFNHHRGELYDDDELPMDFLQDTDEYLEKNGLDRWLGRMAWTGVLDFVQWAVAKRKEGSRKPLAESASLF
jgi:hypothetical protein